MTEKYRSDAFAAIHETMEGLHEVGAINKQTMREFDEACLTPIHISALLKSKPFGCANTFPNRFLHATSTSPKIWFPIGSEAS